MSQHPARVPQIYGLLAEFVEPDDLIVAARGVHERGYRMMEAYTPFPVEGLAEAIGYERNRVPLIVLLGGVTGGLLGFFMQWYSAVIDYPINVAGRPLNSWPAFIPITFEMTILGAALAAVLGMLAMNGLPRPYHPVFNVPGFVLASNNRFFLSIQARDPLFEMESTARLLSEFNAKTISQFLSESIMNAILPEIDDITTARGPRMARGRRLRSLLTGFLLISAAGCRSDMYDQPRYEPLETSSFFADGTSARPLVEGTIPRSAPSSRSESEDSTMLTTGMKDGQLATAPPFPVDRRVLERGQQRYRIFCVPCHGESGDGRGIIVQRGFTAPPPLFNEELRNKPLGHFFEVITHGHGVMYSYAARVPPPDRWAIAAYIRAIQLSQHSLAADLSEADRRGVEEGTDESRIP